MAVWGILKEAIESVLSQHYSNIETIVIDDGSNDNTKEILHAFKNEIRVAEQRNLVPERSRNEGTSVARGQVKFTVVKDYLPKKRSVWLNPMKASLLFPDCRLQFFQSAGKIAATDFGRPIGR